MEGFRNSSFFGTISVEKLCNHLKKQNRLIQNVLKIINLLPKGMKNGVIGCIRTVRIKKKWI